jgi:queuosine precursor transporter
MSKPEPVSPHPKPSQEEFRYLTLIGGLFVATLLISNTTSGKPWQVWEFTLPAGVILFPVSYIFSDILTEVYGYARSRQVIWTGFAANTLMAVAYWIVISLPPASFWKNQAAFALTLGQVPRIVFGSLFGYLAGEFANSIVLAKMKIWTRGRHLWTRTIGSTIIGQAADTFLFVAIAFGGLWPVKYLVLTAGSLYGFKVLYEIAATPITYAAVHFLKTRERIDFFDIGTNFSPFFKG